MKTVILFGSAIFVLATVVLFSRTDGPAIAQSRSDDRVTELETRVAALETAVAGTSEISETPTPTTPAATSPAQTSESVEVIGSAELLYYYFQDSQFGGSQVLGEFLNTSGELIRTPTLSFTFYDAGGSIVDTAETFAVLQLMQPGETVPFTASIDLETGEWVSEKFTAEGGLAADEFDIVFYAEGLAIQNVNEIQASGTSLRVLGEVVNGGTVPASLVQVQALVYGEDGRFFASASGFIDPSELPPGQSAPFEIDTSVDSIGIWTYRLVVSGWPV